MAIDPEIIRLPTPQLAPGSDRGDSSTDNLTSGNSLIFRGTGADPGAVVWVWVEYPDDGVFDYFYGSGEGENYATVVADARGNWSGAEIFCGPYGLITLTVRAFTGEWYDYENASDPLTVQLDRLDPNTTILTRTELPNGTLRITGTTDIYDFANHVTVTFRTPGGDTLTREASITNRTWEVTVPGADGAWQVSAAARDAAGNTDSTPATLSFSLGTPDAPGTPDLVAASDTGDSASDNLTRAALLSFMGSGVAAGASVRVWIDANSNGRYDAALDLSALAVVDSVANTWSVTGLDASGLADGRYAVRAFADLGGAVSESSAALNITLDRTAPGITLNPIASLTNASSLLVGGTTSGEPSSVQFLVTPPGGTEGRRPARLNPDGSWGSLLPTSQDGTYGITVAAQDAAGNVTLAAGRGHASVRVDQTAPEATLTAVAASARALRVNGRADADAVDVLLTLVAEDGSSRQISVPVVAGAWSHVFGGLAPGAWSVLAAARDEAGNVDDTPAIAGAVVGAAGESLAGGEGGEFLLGGAGGDTLVGGGGNDTISGGAGGDSISGGDGEDSLYGGDGNDFLDGGAGDGFLSGDGGADTLQGGAGKDRLNGRAGDDYINGLGGDDLLYGGDGNDLMYGDAGADRMRGEAGADTLLGGADNDTLFGDAGADSLLGEDGDDLIYAGNDDDVVDGGAGADRLRGEAGADTLLGGAGKDTLFGAAGADSLLGGEGDDLAYGGTGNDLLSGCGGADRLYGDDGADTLRGGDDADYMVGGTGDDLLFGDAGRDRLFGNDGADTLVGGDGIDSLFGGAGADTFLFLKPADGYDRIADFDALDHIAVSAAGFAGLEVGVAPLVVAVATGAGPQFIWSAASGKLSFDADGAGGAAAVAVTSFQVTSYFSAEDIRVIA